MPQQAFSELPDVEANEQILQAAGFVQVKVCFLDSSRISFALLDLKLTHVHLQRAMQPCSMLHVSCADHHYRSCLEIPYCGSSLIPCSLVLCSLAVCQPSALQQNVIAAMRSADESYAKVVCGLYRWKKRLDCCWKSQYHWTCMLRRVGSWLLKDSSLSFLPLHIPQRLIWPN